MPTYEYQCKSCGHRFDLYHKVSDPPPAECPECKAGPISKVFSSVGIIFKGSGFHVNDYRKSPPKNETAEDKPGDSKSDGSKSEGGKAGAGGSGDGKAGEASGEKAASDSSTSTTEPAKPAAADASKSSSGSAEKAA